MMNEETLRKIARLARSGWAVFQRTSFAGSLLAASVTSACVSESDDGRTPAAKADASTLDIAEQDDEQPSTEPQQGQPSVEPTEASPGVDGSAPDTVFPDTAFDEPSEAGAAAAAAEPGLPPPAEVFADLEIAALRDVPSAVVQSVEAPAGGGILRSNGAQFGLPASLQGGSWAVYAARGFSSTNEPETLVVDLNGSQGNVFLGVGNLSRNSWNWQGAIAEGMVEFDIRVPSGTYDQEGGTFAFVLLAEANSTITFNGAVVVATRVLPPRPRGVFVIGPTFDGPAAVRALDMVDGMTARRYWYQLEPTEGIYDFRHLDDLVAELQAAGKRLSVEILSWEMPEYLTTDTGVETHLPLGSQGPPAAVPWDSRMLTAYESLITALSSHPVMNADTGEMVPFADHPALYMVEAPIPGMVGLRELEMSVTGHPSYNRDEFIDAVVRAIAISRDAFPTQYGFIAAFGLPLDNESDTRGPLDVELLDRVFAQYNGPEEPTLGLFQENLSAAGPGDFPSSLLSAYGRDGEAFVAFQALTSWLEPFTSPESVANSTPFDGLQFGHENYDARFFELYYVDLENAPWAPGFAFWRRALQY